MLQKQAILYVEKITCTKTTGEAGDDDIWLRITVDGNVSYYPSDESRYHFKKDGGTQYVDLTINVTYTNEVKFELIEYDSSSEDEWIGSHTLSRGSVGSSPESRTVDMDADGKTSGEYTLTYRIISDPIPTLRVLGIRCEQQSAGMNVELVEKIISVASDVTDKAGNVIKKSPRPRAKTIGKAFEAASEVLEAMADLGEWIGRIIEGQHDEVYMKHVESSRGYNGTPFPPGKDFELMKSGDDIYIEEKYGQYLRFPLDRGPVTLQLREHDGGKADVNIGTLTIAPDSLSNNSSAGISGTTVNEGVAVMDGPAVVELASMYGNRGGEGALYHICYSVGFEDWCKPATTDDQEDPNDIDHGGVLFQPRPGKYYRIIAKHSEKMLDVKDNSVENGADIQQWTIAPVENQGNQLFRFEDKGNDYYKIIAKHSGKMLDVRGKSTENGAVIQQWAAAPVENQDNQLFRVEGKGDGYYHIIAKHSGKILDIKGKSTENGALTQQWTVAPAPVENQNNQLFRFELEDDIVEPEPGRPYAIIAKHSRKAISVRYGDQADGANVYQLLFLAFPKQVFTLKDQGNGYYSFIARHSEKALDVADASQENGANVQQMSLHLDQADNQMFRLEDQGDGYYSIVAKHSGKVLNVAGASTKDEANIQQWEFAGGDNQLFRFIPMDE